MRSESRRAFTVIELLIVIAIMAILISIILPAAEKVRHRGYIDLCASNLRQIGTAETMYANENHGAYARTTYVSNAPPTQGTGAAAPNPFGPGGPSPNDVTAAMFLLMRAEKLPTKILICPYNDVYEYEPDKADVSNRSNFTNYKLNCGYSIANPYPSDQAVAAGYKWTNKLPAGFALAADVNPGTDAPRDDVLGPSIDSPPPILRKANSQNHEKEGQNVLFADGHVDYLISAFVGMNRDNIYDNKANQVNASPVDREDSVLLPTDD